MKKSDHPENGYYLYNHADLLHILSSLLNRKIILFGVSFALLDFLDFVAARKMQQNFSPGLTIIETGGMKGRKEEMTKDELLEILKKGFNTEHIYSEYSMTELLSQAYTLDEDVYYSPNWMKIMIRKTDNPFSYVADGKTGAINIIDLANRHSCSFIATQDMGKICKNTHVYADKSIHQSFQILGRIDHSDIRGCSMLVS